MREISTWSGYKTTLLHVAAGYGCEFCVPFLLELGADVNAKDV